MTNESFEALLQENRTFSASDDFKKKAAIKDPGIYQTAANDRLKFWESFANDLHWFQPWDATLEWNKPFAKWFVNGKTNMSYNCLDRHLQGSRATKTAILWEGEPGDVRKITYEELHRDVCRFANGLKSLGIVKGDRVTLYMPMVPELAVAMLACARIGAPHSVVFGGFSPDSLRDRINDCESKLVITSDGGWRRGEIVPLKENTDAALEGVPCVKKVIVLCRTENEIPMVPDRDIGWDDVIDGQSEICDAEPMDAEDMLFLLYTSGTTGKPKGILHTTGGYMTGVYATMKWIFDIREEDTYWCTADIGWVTGHSYIVYGPLLNGATTMMYEGAPNHPGKDRFWSLVEKHKVNVFYTAPTAIRAFMKWGEGYPKRYDLSSLRLLGSVGEPINPEAWVWYHQTIGGGNCPVVDTWWQTETGHIMISPLPGITELRPGSATRPFPGIDADIVNEKGESVNAGYLVLKTPWPGMLRGIYGDDARYKEQYWSKYPEWYFTGDGCKRDKEGNFWLLGRVDDVLNVSGHRLSTMEIESALVDHKAVAEAAVIGRSDDLKGNAVVAFVTLKGEIEGTAELNQELRAHVTTKIGALARPDEITFTAELPKTRSGKIMRRLLRDIAEGRALGDTTTLADAAVVQSLKEKYGEE